MKMKIMQVMSADESAGWQPCRAYNPARPQAGPMKMKIMQVTSLQVGNLQGLQPR